MQNKQMTEYEALRVLARMEDLAEKKAKIYSRLLTDADLAKTMETLSVRHEERKERLLLLLGEKPSKSKNGAGVYASSEEDERK